MSDSITPLRQAVLTAYAFHLGYTVEPVSWEGSFEDELAEGWVWRAGDGFSHHDTVEALIDGFPVLPADLLRELDATCPWGAPAVMP